MPTRDLNVKIDGDPKGFQAAAAKAALAARRLEQSLARMEAKQKTTRKSATLMRSELLALAAGATTVAPAFAASGAGVVAFAALAAPAILKVVKAQQDLVANWDNLSEGEKAAAVGLRNLIGQYKALARSMEPETLGLFNQALGMTSRQMPKLVPIARGVSSELGHFLDNLERAIDGPEGQEFLSFLEQASGPATQQIASTLGSAAGAATNLLQALGPVAGVGLKTVAMLLDLVGAVSDVAPGLVQMAVLTMALRGPLGGLGGLLGTAGGKLTAFGDGAAGVKGKAGGLGAVLTGMGTILSGPWGMAVTGAIALLAVFAASQADAAAQVAEFEGAIRQDAGALGVATRALTTHKLEEEGLLDLAQRSGVSMSAYTDAILGNKDAHAEVTSVIDRQIAALKKQNDENEISFEGYRAGVEPLIELRSALRGKNETINEAVASYKRLQDAQKAGVQPTDAIKVAWDIASDASADLKTRVDALTAAFDAYFSPALAVLGATNRWKDAVAETGQVLKDTGKILRDGDSTDQQRNEALRARREQLEGQLGVLRDWAQAEFRATKNVKASSQAMIDQFPALLRLAGGSREGKAALDTLIAAMGGTVTRARGATTAVDKFGNRVTVLPNGKVVVVKANTAQAQAALSATQTRINNLQGKTVYINMIRRDFGVNVGPKTGVPWAPGSARGGIVRRAGGGMVRGPGTTTSDSIPALVDGGGMVMLSDQEFVINARQTKRHRGLIEAINAGKFAGGGLVGDVRGYAAGGPVDAPLTDYVSRFMDGKALSKTDYAKVIRARRDAVDQLRRAERKLAADRRAHKSARTIADDEARVAKERRDLATATEKLSAASARYKRSKLTPTARLTASLNLGIKNTAAFIRNLETIAKRGFPELARQLLAMGGPEAEKYAAGAAKLSASKLKALAGKVATAAKYQAKLEALPDILAVKAARKAGAKSIPQVMRMTGLSEEDLQETYAAMGYARGGIHRYARGGIRPGPGIATRPTLLFGEGRAPEGFVPYDPAYRPQAMGLVARMAGDFGMTRGSGGGAAGHVTVTLHVAGADSDLKRMIRKMVRIDGRGSVQVAFGKSASA
ncbi:hypothetical protein [Sphaerisporangium sp. TRM90804]|uniref:hypothetical protein n=1 Tax=Sphaerisporangium sp. TRM90804 TaxID=3031113 RepID=UPI0024482498|nr:hypothetical protein [Sphaerisporangium sp. TRM90804]MDH2425788.1 hypothetical protein [Sphaerisporangium sp. TRM90804]